MEMHKDPVFISNGKTTSLKHAEGEGPGPSDYYREENSIRPKMDVTAGGAAPVLHVVNEETGEPEPVQPPVGNF